MKDIDDVLFSNKQEFDKIDKDLCEMLATKESLFVKYDEKEEKDIINIIKSYAEKIPKEKLK